MGLLSKGKKAKWRAIPLSDSQKVADKFLQAQVEKQIELPTEQTAGISTAEQTGLGAIGEAFGEGGILQQALGSLQDTLAGKYDPRTSPFFKGLREEIESVGRAGISKSIGTAQRLTGAPSSDLLGQVGDIQTKTDRNVLQLLGGMFENERGKQFQAAQNIPNIFNQALAPLFSFGARDRELQQQQYGREFAGETANILAPFRYQAPIAQNIMDQQRYSFSPGVQGSSWLQDATAIAGLAGSVAGMGGGGGVPGGVPTTPNVGAPAGYNVPNYSSAFPQFGG